MAAQIPQRKLQLRDKQLAHRAAGGTNVRCANGNFVCAVSALFSLQQAVDKWAAQERKLKETTTHAEAFQALRHTFHSFFFSFPLTPTLYLSLLPSRNWQLTELTSTGRIQCKR